MLPLQLFILPNTLILLLLLLSYIFSTDDQIKMFYNLITSICKIREN